ncbi:D-alanyl-D-alanine carboxypeptidase [Anoxybacillus pushchinoensis]|uniref:D-alanyl-D-alanine carboxypeptidase n=1 Tax=Anoxybacillus pushchinoensis TaxID=150248 RepID=A0A1I0TDL6_9BACL|nr:M15 family metallopeptidase [Anoxybacillus pushchinoensis]SFA49076.1 D-alanyl-D-alanine carboxypeptidase [Anoxybacillus pushchinoensis]
MKKWLYCFVMVVSGCQSSGLYEQEQKPSPPIQVEQPARSSETPAPSSEAEEQEELVLEERFWNQIEVQNGIKVITNPDNILVLVNKEQQLPSDYKPADLVIPNVPFTFKETNVEKRYMRAEAAKALEAMFTAAKKQQIMLYAVSGYRSYERQQQLFSSEVQRLGEEKAVVAVAMPGRSEHQTGLAIDITSPSVQYAITPAFGDTLEGKWVAEHAHEFGFIIRYPKGKEHITKYQYEPWHLRYVGEKAAKVIYEKQITLEEYFQIVKKI